MFTELYMTVTLLLYVKHIVLLTGWACHCRHCPQLCAGAQQWRCGYYLHTLLLPGRWLCRDPHRLC